MEATSFYRDSIEYIGILIGVLWGYGGSKYPNIKVFSSEYLSGYSIEGPKPLLECLVP